MTFYLKRCRRCDTDFTARHVNALYCEACRSNRDKARRTPRIVKPAHFIGVDGEGITLPDGSHHYVLLSVGDASLTNGGDRLPWHMIFEFLYDQFLEYPDAIFVGFYLGYDFTQWFRTMPEDRARMLLSSEGIATRQRMHDHLPPFPVTIDGWHMDCLGTRRLKLRPASEKRWMTICDAGPFYQSSFLKAIDPKGWDHPIVTDADYSVILEGKQHRSTAGLDRDMVRYNVTENRVMSDLMKSLHDGFESCGIKLGRNQWFGPGQAAQAWLGNIHAPLGEEIREHMPRGALDAAQQSYYGGWFEIFRHGPQPGVTYEYDINSAYPHVIATLPDFRYGSWDHASGSLGTAAHTLVRAMVHSPRIDFGAMPHRMPDGRILRPVRTAGWYWQHEIEAAQRAGILEIVEVFESWSFTPSTTHAPYRAIADLYGKRLEVGKNSPAGKALKLMYNSAYGKMAQSVGTPKYAAAVCASLITSGTRTMILDAIATHPRGASGVIMVATDGIYFDSPHPSLELSGTKLGAWDVTEKRNLSVFMPGVYWDDNARERIRANMGFHFKSRGVSATDLATEIARIDDMWAVIPDGPIDVESFPAITLPIRFGMVTATEALARGKWWTAGNVFSSEHGTGKERRISANPSGKRYGAWKTEGVIYSNAWAQAPVGDVWSTPYENRFGDDYVAEDALLSADGMNPVSEIVDLLYKE